MVCSRSQFLPQGTISVRRIPDDPANSYRDVLNEILALRVRVPNTDRTVRLVQVAGTNWRRYTEFFNLSDDVVRLVQRMHGNMDIFQFLSLRIKIGNFHAPLFLSAFARANEAGEIVYDFPGFYAHLLQKRRFIGRWRTAATSRLCNREFVVRINHFAKLIDIYLGNHRIDPDDFSSHQDQFEASLSA